MKRKEFLRGIFATGATGLVGGCVSNQPMSYYPPSGGLVAAQALPTPTPSAPPQPPAAYAQPAPFRLGIERLRDNGFDLLQGQRVGLVCNQASTDRFGTNSRVILQRDSRVRLTALYAPEHGIEGDIGAGKYVPTRRDSVTGLPVHSLYASTRKPSRAQLANIDLLIYDLQDLGVRSYTYLSTLFRCMEACAEQGKTMVVLDRPNPLGGQRVEGPPLERRYTSFVGNAPVPYVHGMTSGEAAALFHGERMVRRPRIHIVPMTGWRRNQLWSDTGIRWRATSPNIPRALSGFYYVATGMLGGASGVDVGIGTSHPFGYAGGDGVDGNALSYAMSRRGLSGVSFAPYHRSRSGRRFGGVRLTIDPRRAGSLCALDVILIDEINRRRSGRVLSGMSSSTRDLFNKVYGSDRLYRDLQRGLSGEQIAASWAGSEAAFRSQRQRYLLYG